MIRTPPSAQSVGFIRAHASGNGNLPAPSTARQVGGRARADISIYGQESNYTWRLAKMNLAICGIEGRIAHGDTFHDDCFPDLRADWVGAPSLGISAAL